MTELPHNDSFPVEGTPWCSYCHGLGRDYKAPRDQDGDPPLCPQCNGYGLEPQADLAFLPETEHPLGRQGSLRERCPECGAADEYTGDLCYSCGYGHMPCPRCRMERGAEEQMDGGRCLTCGYTVATDGPPPAADITAETPGIIPPALPGRLGPRREGNILDPVQETLDPTVFLRPDTPEPVLKPELRHWIQQTIIKALDKHGYDGMEDWLSLVFTGSLTTYQYSERSDCDISLFVDTPKFPEWSRAEMIGIMVDACDGQLLPGTTHELQAFVVDTSKLTKDDLYQPGLRSGYDLHTQRWLVPPDKSRVRDVKREQDIDHTYALEVADKMERLIRYEPDKAVRYYKQIHHRRQRDQISGKGDFAQSNVVYKMLDQRGLFDKLRDLGVKIAKAEPSPAVLESEGPKIFDYEEHTGPWIKPLSPEPHRDVTDDEV